MTFYPSWVYVLVIGIFSRRVPSFNHFYNQLILLGIHVVWSSCVFHIVRNGYLYTFCFGTPVFFCSCRNRAFLTISSSAVFLVHVLCLSRRLSCWSHLGGRTCTRGFIRLLFQFFCYFSGSFFQFVVSGGFFNQ